MYLSFLLCLLLLFSQLFVSPPQTTILPFEFILWGDGLDYCLLYNVVIEILAMEIMAIANLYTWNHGWAS